MHTFGSRMHTIGKRTAHLTITSLKQANEALERYNQESNLYKRHCLEGMSAEEKLRSFQA